MYKIEHELFIKHDSRKERKDDLPFLKTQSTSGLYTSYKIHDLHRFSPSFFQLSGDHVDYSSMEEKSNLPRSSTLNAFFVFSYKFSEHWSMLQALAIPSLDSREDFCMATFSNDKNSPIETYNLEGRTLTYFNLQQVIPCTRLSYVKIPQNLLNKNNISNMNIASIMRDEYLNLFNQLERGISNINRTKQNLINAVLRANEQLPDERELLLIGNLKV